MHKLRTKRSLIAFGVLGLMLTLASPISMSGRLFPAARASTAVAEKGDGAGVHRLSATPPARLASLEPTGMAKPVADLRDYNGTPGGAPGTGTIGYSTLYRDNQDNGQTSGCNGEGCGRHPGVDIRVASGTAVFASLSGFVVRSECNGSGWGGLIVIKSTNPWNSAETLYFTYAHLKSRTYADGREVQPGQWVQTGMQIGKSGGTPGVDNCHGNSDGPHLHFQIDKNDGNTEPWYPASGTLHQRDSNFLVTTKTYNPIVFVTGGYRWSFNQPGDRELWDLFSFQRWGVSNGALWVDGVGDTYIRRGGDTNCGQTRACSGSFAAEANMYQRVYLDLHNVCFGNPGKIYFTTSSDPSWSEPKSVSYYPSGQGPYREHIYMTQNSEWKGIITGLRIDPAVNCSSGDDPTYYGEITVER